MIYSIPRIKKNLMRFDLSNNIREVKVNDRRFYYRSSVEFLHSYYEILRDQIYNFRSSSEKPRIIDCGANMGIAVNFFKDLYPQSEVIAFEPDEMNYQILEKNTKGLTNIFLHKKAVWIKEGEISFLQDGTMSSKIDDKQSGDSVKIRCVRLAEFLTEKTDFLKIDIEGAEYEVMKDIESSLGNVANLFIEYHGMVDETYKLAEIFQILNESGFLVYCKMANDKIKVPFYEKRKKDGYEVQLNLFAYRN